MGIYSPGLSHILGSLRIPMCQRRPTPGSCQETVERLALIRVLVRTSRSTCFFVLLFEGLCFPK